jgi:hypothetical protein
VGNYKTVISVVAVLLTFVGYVPYLSDTIKGKTKPHIYSWFIWGFVTAIIFGLQVSAGAGAGSWVTLAAACVSFLIFFLGLRSGEKNIAKTDTFFFILAWIALGLWLIIKQAVLSVILVTTIEMLGLVPTVRKSWNQPYSETLFTYELNSLRHGLSFLALSHYNLITWLYPVSWSLANGLFSLMLIARRKQIGKRQNGSE